MYGILNHKARVRTFVDRDHLAVLTAVTGIIHILNIGLLDLLMRLKERNDVLSWDVLSRWSLWSETILRGMIDILMQSWRLTNSDLPLDGCNLPDVHWIMNDLWHWTHLHIMSWTLKMDNWCVLFLLDVGATGHHFIMLMVVDHRTYW